MKDPNHPSSASRRVTLEQHKEAPSVRYGLNAEPFKLSADEKYIETVLYRAPYSTTTTIKETYNYNPAMPLVLWGGIYGASGVALVSSGQAVNNSSVRGASIGLAVVGALDLLIGTLMEVSPKERTYTQYKVLDYREKEAGKELYRNAEFKFVSGRTPITLTTTSSGLIRIPINKMNMDNLKYKIHLFQDGDIVYESGIYAGDLDRIAQIITYDSRSRSVKKKNTSVRANPCGERLAMYILKNTTNDVVQAVIDNSVNQATDGAYSDMQNVFAIVEIVSLVESLRSPQQVNALRGKDVKYIQQVIEGEIEGVIQKQFGTSPEVAILIKNIAKGFAVECL